MILEANDRHAITSIIRAAEMNIMLQTGLHIKLVERFAEPIKEDVAVLMGVIAKSMRMTMDDYFGNRARPNVDLRCLAVLFIKELFPEMTLKEMGKNIGNLDHTTVIHMHSRGLDYLKSREEIFSEKYNRARVAVDEWLKTISYIREN